MDKVSPVQLRALLILDFLSVGILCMPQLAVMQGRNGFGIVAIGTALALLYAFVIEASNGSITEFKPLLFLFFVKSVLVAGMLLRIFSELIAITLLYNSKISVIGAVIVLVALYGSSKGGAARGRMAQMVMPVLLAVLVFFLVLSAKNGDFTSLQPLMCGNLKSLVFPGVLASLMFFPLEFITLIKSENKAGLNSVVAVLISGILLMAMVVIWLARFNYGNMNFPVLDLMYNGDFSTAFIKHQQGMVLGVIIVAFYFVLNSLIFCSSVSLENLFNIKSVIIPCAVIIYALSFLPETIESAKEILYAALLLGDGLFLVGVPVAFLFAGKKGVSA